MLHAHNLAQPPHPARALMLLNLHRYRTIFNYPLDASTITASFSLHVTRGMDGSLSSPSPFVGVRAPAKSHNAPTMHTQQKARAGTVIVGTVF